jgi:hypothetical protein
VLKLVIPVRTPLTGVTALFKKLVFRIK